MVSLSQQHQQQAILVLVAVFVLCGLSSWTVEAFVASSPHNFGSTCLRLASSSETTSSSSDNKAMAFLRKRGKVGGNKDFTNAMGVDEGPAGKSGSSVFGKPIKKNKSAYPSCVVSGIIDDMTDTFPYTSSGTQWSGITDRVMGGVSSGSITREESVVGSSSDDGEAAHESTKVANVLRGKVSTANGGGFVQMATDLSLDPSTSVYVDASEYDGVELDVLFKGDGNDKPEHFNIHLKNAASERQFSSYRATFGVDTPGTWQTILVPWSEFVGHGPGCQDTPLDTSTLRRIGVVAIGREMEVYLALGGIRFYSVI